MWIPTADSQSAVVEIPRETQAGTRKCVFTTSCHLGTCCTVRTAQCTLPPSLWDWCDEVRTSPITEVDLGEACARSVIHHWPYTYTGVQVSRDFLDGHDQLPLGYLRPAQPQTLLNPRRHRGGGLMQPPLRFFWNVFFVNRSIVTIFSIAFRPYFLRPP